MRISVIITTYNEEENIADCIDSLLKQTLKADEIILVDDGSTDRTLEAGKNYPVKIIQSPHMGRCYARNLGWRAAIGDIVCIAEADSVLNPGWIENIELAFREGADAVIDQRRCFYINTYLQKCLNADFVIRFHKYKPFSAWAFKKSVLEATGGYNEYLDQSEERELGKRIVAKGYKIKLARKAIQYHKGEPRKFGEFIKRVFNAERKRARSYLRIYPEEKPWTKLFILFFVTAVFIFCLINPIYFHPFFILLAIIFIYLFFKIGFVQRGFWLTKIKYVFGLSLLRFIRGFITALGFIDGSLDKIFNPHLLYKNINSQRITSKKKLNQKEISTSVVIPAYNEEANIVDCLRSFQNQTRKPDEIILVDDGSTDKTVALAQAMGATVIKSSHAGRSRPRNLGWKKARGNVIAFADADTIFASNWLEAVLNKIVDYDAVAEKRAVYQPDSFYLKCQQANYDLNYSDYIPFCAWVIRKSVLEDVGGFDEGLNVAEERDLGKRMLEKKYSLVFTDKAIQYHRGKPRNFWEGIRHSYRHTKERKAYLDKHPEERFTFRAIFMAGLLMVILYGIFIKQDLWFVIILISIFFFVLFFIIFIKQAFIKNGWKLINKKKYLFGLTGIRFIENITNFLASI